MFQNSSNVNISGGAFINNNTVVNEQNGMTGLQILHQWVSDGAAHDSVQHAPVCHPDTRRTIIGEIMSWIGDPSRKSSVLWFNGPAGAGKTAIAQSLCKLCAAAQWLAGSFFFSRYAHSRGRSNAEFLFPTISFGLSYAIPKVGKIINDVVANDPSIPTKALEIQLQKLILEPLQQFSEELKKQVSEESMQPIVIIIDGLDECDSEGVQSYVLRLLGSVFQRPSVGVCDRKICFIVTSRPEPWIRDEFTIEPLFSITRQIFLGQTSEANNDIRTFLRLGFTEIHDSPKHRLTMSNVPKPWPSYRVLDDLVDKASGQFIYPATVLKFVGDPNYRPTYRLDIIASMPAISPSALASKPLALLDQLYSQILSTSSDTQRTLDILSALIVMQASTVEQGMDWRIFNVELLRIAEKLLGLQPGDGSLALRMIHSLVRITGRSLMADVDDNFSLVENHWNYQEEDEIRFHHKSFIDYLLDSSRSLEYCVDVEEMNTRLALACIVTMQTFSLQPTSRIACFTWGYATHCWNRLVTESGNPRQTLLQTLLSFDLLGCYLDALGPKEMEPECRDTLKRVAFPSKPDPVFSKDVDKLHPEEDNIDKTCPDPSDINITREILFSLGSPNFTISGFSSRLESVLNWMKKNPESPPELITQYRVVVNIFRHYSLPLRHRPAIPNDDYFRDIRLLSSQAWSMYRRRIYVDTRYSPFSP